MANTEISCENIKLVEYNSLTNVQLKFVSVGAKLVVIRLCNVQCAANICDALTLFDFVR